MRRPWTEAEVEKLRQHYATPPLNLHALAAELGRSYESVTVKAGRLGLGSYFRAKGRKPKQVTFFTNERFKASFHGGTTAAYIAAVGHPRGMLGKKHTAATLALVSEASRAQWADPKSKLNSPAQSQRRSDEMVRRVLAGEMRNRYTRSRGGKRADLGGRYFRSSWEANYARLLELQKRNGAITAWDFECHTFEFVGIKRGTRLYTPDFKVTFPDGHHEWHEVKGWMDGKSATRLKRMAKYFPAEKVVVVGAESFKAFRRQGFDRMIPNWESA